MTRTGPETSLKLHPSSIVLAAGLALAPLVHAKQKLCVYDPSGPTGEAYRAAMDYRLQMAEHGADIELKAFIN